MKEEGYSDFIPKMQCRYLSYHWFPFPFTDIRAFLKQTILVETVKGAQNWYVQKRSWFRLDLAICTAALNNHVWWYLEYRAKLLKWKWKSLWCFLYDTSLKHAKTSVWVPSAWPPAIPNQPISTYKYYTPDSCHNVE